VRTKTKRILWLTPLIIAAGYFGAVIGFRSEPSGCVASYDFFPHSSNDVLIFSHGTVTLHTCCGDESFGTYARSADGKWIWHYTREAQPRSADIRIRAHFFSISLERPDDPSVTLSLRRRVFADLPF